MRVEAITIAAAALAILPSQASAASECKITGISAPGVSAVYDPFDTTFSPSPVQISLNTSGNCSGAKVELALVPSVTSPITGSQVRLVDKGSVLLATVRTAGQPREIVNEASAFASNPWLLTVGSAGSIAGDASLALDLKPGQVGGPGTYRGDLQLVARLTADGQQSQAFTQVNLSVTVKPSVRAAVGSGQSIDLGELKTGTVGGPVTFDAYANVDYTVTLSSDNNFTMRRRGSTGQDQGVPYTPTLSQGTITASASTKGVATARQALFDAPSTGIRHHSLSVKVDPFGNLPAGQYSDVMTLEIAVKV